MSWTSTQPYFFGQVRALETGQPMAASFDPGRITHRGRFAATVIRRGHPNSVLGAVELLLLAPGSGLRPSSESIAVCKVLTDGQRSLLFPPFTGSEFSEVKRHGFMLSLIATSCTLVLETSIGSEDIGRWGRILNRLFGTSLQASEDTLSGLGISLPPAPAASSMKQSPSGGRSLIPTSRSAKRISIGLGSGGLANDLAALLGSLNDGSDPFTSLMNASSSDPGSGIVTSTSGFSGSTAGSNNDNGALLGSDTGNISNANPVSTAAFDASRTKTSTNPPSDVPSNSSVKSATESKSKRLDVPAAPFASFSSRSTGSTPDSDMSGPTPSPESLFLSGDGDSDATPSVGRLQSILKKEQQQNQNRYSYSPAGARSGSHPPSFLPPPVPTSTSTPSGANHDVLGSHKEPLKESQPIEKSQNMSSVASKAPEVLMREVSQAPASVNHEAPEQPPTPVSPGVRFSSKKKPGVKLMGMLKKLRRPKKPSPSQHEFHAPRDISPEIPSPDQRVASPKETDSESTPKASEPPEVPEDRGRQVATKTLPRLPSIPEFGQEGEEPEVKQGGHNTNGSSGVSGHVGGNTSADSINGSSRDTSRDVISRDTTLSSIDSDPKEKPAAVAIATENNGSIVAHASSGSVSALSFRSARSFTSSKKSHRAQDSVASGNSATSEASKPKPANSGAPATDPAAAWQRFMDSVKSEATKKADEEAIIAQQAAEDAAKQQRELEARQAADREAARQIEKQQREQEAAERLRRQAEIQTQNMAKSLDPGSGSHIDTTQPILRRVFDTQSTPALVSQSSSEASGLSNASVPSFFSSGGSSAPSVQVSMFHTQMWVSKWTVSRWTPLSQLELRIEVAIMGNGGARILITNPGGIGVTALRFSASCEIRRASAHDVEVKVRSDTYMFRSRDAEAAQRFLTTLATLQMDLRDPSTYPSKRAALNADSESASTSTSTSSSDSLEWRRRTLVPPTLAKPRFSRLKSSTIIEE